jgi:hypothetical protein
VTNTLQIILTMCAQSDEGEVGYISSSSADDDYDEDNDADDDEMELIQRKLAAGSHDVAPATRSKKVPSDISSSEASSSDSSQDSAPLARAFLSLTQWKQNAPVNRRLVLSESECCVMKANVKTSTVKSVCTAKTITASATCMRMTTFVFLIHTDMIVLVIARVLVMPVAL